MSRSFFQELSAGPGTRRNSDGHLQYTSHVFIGQHLSSVTVATMMIEGHRLYPGASSPAAGPNARDEIIFENTTGLRRLTERTREALIQGRYAPYDRTRRLELNSVHDATVFFPEIIPILEVNGYIVNESVMNSM